MAAITRTSPLDLGEVRKTQRRVTALLNVPDQFTLCIGHHRRRQLPADFCYVCSHLDPRGRGKWRGRGWEGNPYRHLFSKTCPHHLTPTAPHPTFVGSDDDDDGFAEDGFDEGSWDDDEGVEGALFDTSILRDDTEKDPRLFSLPPVFGKPGDHQPLKQKRRSKNGRLVPVVSENTFLSTNTKQRGAGGKDTDPSGDLHLPKLSTNPRVSLMASVEGAEGQGERKRKQKDPRRLHSERIDRRGAGDDDSAFAGRGARATRSDSVVGMGLTQSHTDLSREKTDPPPQPITVSIRNQDGEVVHSTPLENVAPGTVPSEAFVDRREGRGKPRKKREKKHRKPGSRDRDGSASPSFSGSISISRETTLSGWESPPDYFLSRLRSASWCECPDHVVSEARCPECRRVKDHEKWCVSRNVLCQNCGKAFKRKYSQLERKSSFSTIPASGGMTMMTINNIPTTADSPSKSRHQNCSPTKLSSEHRSTTAVNANDAGAVGPNKKSGNNRVRISGEGISPQFVRALPDSGVDDDDNDEVREEDEGLTSTSNQRQSRRSYLPPVDAHVHQRAYNLALADAKLKATMTRKQKSKRLEHPNGTYFSYFPLLKTRKPQKQQQKEGEEEEATRDVEVSPTPPQQTIGLRADVREGKQLKVKKGLKHILGDVKLDDYYPGGKRYPKHVS